MERVMDEMKVLESGYTSPLIDHVLAQIQEDISMGNVTPLVELLHQVPDDKLITFLPECDNEVRGMSAGWNLKRWIALRERVSTYSGYLQWYDEQK